MQLEWVDTIGWAYR